MKTSNKRVGLPMLTAILTLALGGQAKYKRNSDRRHITFTCVVDRDQQKILQIKYDKE